MDSTINNNNNKVYNNKDILQIEQQKYRNVTISECNSEENNEEMDSKYC